MTTKKHPDHTETETPAPVASKPAQKAPIMGDRVYFRDENDITSCADVTGVAADGSLFLHILYRDGISGAFQRSNVKAAERDFPGWFWPEK